jgi:hypothetical protein
MVYAWQWNVYLEELMHGLVDLPRDVQGIAHKNTVL